MKKMLSGVLVCLLILTCVCGSWAEDAEATGAEEANQPITYDYDELTVAVTTPMTGNFFTSLWGNGSSDIDVRTLIHGYNLVEWDVEQSMFVPDESVISGITAQEEANGDVTFIIMLYDDLYYSDGSRITAWDYAFSMLLTMAPEMKELGAAVKTPTYISGYSNYISGVSKGLSGVRVLGDDNIHITIDAGYLPFFYELGLLDCNPYPIAVIAPGVKVADDGNGVYLTNAEPDSEAPVFTAELLKGTILDETKGYRTHPSVTSGPYLLTSYENGVAQFEINPQYKGNSKGRKPMIPRIRVSSVPSEELAPSFRNGSVTLLNKVTEAGTISECMKIVAGQETMAFANYERSGLGFINFNTERSPMNDPAVRKAIAYLADREETVRETLGGYGTRALGYFGLGQWMYLLLNGTVGYPVDESLDERAAEAEKAKWEALSLDTIEQYERDPEKGNTLLAKAGWNLNERGEAFVPGTDNVRYRKTEAGFVPLKLTLAYAEKSAAGPELEGKLVQSLAEAGIALEVKAIPADELLNQYYRLDEAEYDMLFLATNFDTLYDPSLSFVETADGHHVWKTSGLVDDELWELAVSMRKTEVGDLLGYCGKWLKFQQRFMEQLPLLPMYTNVYFDFYPRVLHDYNISAHASWPQAIIEAYLADYIPEEAQMTEADMDDPGGTEIP